MAFNDYIQQTRSQKIILATIEAKQKLKLFDLYSGAIYRKKSEHFVVNFRSEGIDLVQATSNTLNAGEWYYSPLDGYLYVRLSDDSNPKTKTNYATYRFFFSNQPANLPYDFNNGIEVHFDSRLKAIGTLKLELDYENTGIALETNSNISLHNNDGYFDSIFDRYIFENSSVKFYSWNKNLNHNEAKLIYRGFIKDKSFSSTEIKFNIVDELSKLRSPIEWSKFSNDDGLIDEATLNKPKRIILGRVDKAKTVGIDKVLDGYTLTGSISGDADRNVIDGTVTGTASQDKIYGATPMFTVFNISAGDEIKIIDGFSEYTYTVASVDSTTQITITGTLSASFSGATIRNLELLNNRLEGVGTSFLSELSPSDKIKVTVNDLEYEYGVESVESDTLAILSDEFEVSFTSITDVKCSPAIPYREKNRSWNIAGHKLREYSVTITEIIDINQIAVDDIVDITDGDSLLINGFYYIVARVNGNKIRLNQGFQTATVVNDLVTKLPVRYAYVQNQRYLFNRDFTINNTVNNAIIEFNSLAEFNVAVIKKSNESFTFTSGSRIVTAPSSDTDLTTLLKPRDWIKLNILAASAWYEVLAVDTLSVTLRTPANFSGTGTILYKTPEYIDDNSLVTVDCLGLDDGGEWIRTPAQAVRWLLEKTNLIDVNDPSFIEAEGDCDYTLSLALPESIGSDMPNARDVISKINDSVFGSLYLDSNFQYTYKILNADRPESMVTVKDEDIISFDINTKTSIYNRISLNYRPYIDTISGSDTFKNISLESDFVNDTSKSTNELAVTSYLYYDDDAMTIAERWLFFKSLTQSIVNIKSKINFYPNSLNDAVMLDLARTYTKYGGLSSRKLGLINMISKEEYGTSIQVNDLGNVFARVPCIAPDDTNDYVEGDDNVDNFGYILDNDTETPDPLSEIGLGSNLIG